MKFNTFEFWIFFAILWGAYLVLPRRAQNRLLLLASYVFYGAWDWRFLSLLGLSTVVDYQIGLSLAATDQPRRRRFLLAVSVVVNLGVLGFFKYADFFSASLVEILDALGLEVHIRQLQVILPVGISFYTFQTLSYTIDVYRRHLAPTRNLLDFALYVAFFPQLVAGPIERAGRLLPQIQSSRILDWDGVGSGAWLCLWGLFKKVVIADNLAVLVDAVFAPAASPTSVELILATYAFAYQIYCDFSGYTDIARGLARMMGIDLMKNFDLPYFSRSPADFWRRWHISLSTWLRDYLYIPLGGNRGGTGRTNRNLMTTMLLGGLWHGAGWPFVLWGGYHGALLVLHRLMRPALGQVSPRSAAARALWDIVCVAVIFHLVCLGWLIFRAESLAHLADLVTLLAGPLEVGLAAQWTMPFLILIGPLLAFQLAQLLGRDLEVVLRWPLPARVVVYAAVMWMIILVGEDGGRPFVYFQF